MQFPQRVSSLSDCLERHGLAVRVDVNKRLAGRLKDVVTITAGVPVTGEGDILKFSDSGLD